MFESSSTPLHLSGAQTSVDTRNATNQILTRQPLQRLKAIPLNKMPQPVTTYSSPLESIITSKSMEPPTPPNTPLQRHHKRSSTSAGSISLERVTEVTAADAATDLQEPGKTDWSCVSNESKSWENTQPRAYTKQYRRQGTSQLGTEEFGRGVWSIVYRCVETSSLPAAPLTPPTSPMESSSPVQTNKTLAVKAPSRKDAHKILDHEARILTYLHAFPEAPEYLVPFYGYDAIAHSIVLSAIPLNLDMLVKASAKTARANFSTRTMFEPVIGVKEWQSLTTALISGLSFLRSNQCVHGDIKPANLLLQPSEANGFYTPLYCDFSSSLISTDPAPTEITALTQEYASPELLASLTSPRGQTLPTPAADVYALAVTLLYAAIGESPYAGAKMEFVKLSMAREGRPLYFAKSGEQASRVRKGSFVEKCLARAMVKDVEIRPSVEQWRIEVEELMALTPNL